MNDEIKELLKHIEILDNTDYILHSNKAKALLDYITNLQEEKDSLDDYNRHLHNELKDCKSRNAKAIDIAYEYSQVDGEHHKTWCIDQIVRALTDNNYNEFVKEYENNGEYKWNVGIAP